MSTRRPSPTFSSRTTVLGAIALAALLAACADAPSGPRVAAPGGGLSAGKTPEEQAFDDSVKAVQDSTKKAQKEQTSAARRLAKDEFEALKQDWKAYQHDVEHGTVQAVGLRCEPSNGDSKTKKIGPKGGGITVGAHQIDIPAGALASDVEITVSEKAGNTMELEFQPHGLQFAKPVEMTFNYGRCVVADAQALDVVYVGNGWKLLETVPSSDKRSAHRISALTDHFSGYMVSTGRR
jgi:hypothetical protein